MRSHRSAQWAILLGNFVIGVGVLAPAGLINQISAAFRIDIPTASTLIAYGAALLCIYAPLFAFITNRIDRRVLLTGSLAIYCVGHVISAFATSFAALMTTRLVMLVSAATFTPQAASTVGLFVPVERRSTAVAFVFLGWSVASAVGVPLASLIGAHFGWSTSYKILGVICALATIAVAITIPRQLKAPPLPLAAWGKVFTSAPIMVVLAVTALSLTGQFVVYPFIAAELKRSLAASPSTIAGFLAVYGVGGVVGSIVSTSIIGRLGASRTVGVCLTSVMSGLFLWSVSLGAFALIGLSLFIWGLGVSPANSGQQARLITLDPSLASASVALNTSAIYIGQAIGTLTGGSLFATGHTQLLGATAGSLVACALLISMSARKRSGG
jgi:MFS transporter, DHA1 family, inner membrane transport protein